MAVSSSFISLTYGSEGSGVIYNIYADKLLQTNLINSSVSTLKSETRPNADEHFRSMTCRRSTTEVSYVCESSYLT